MQMLVEPPPPPIGPAGVVELPPIGPAGVFEPPPIGPAGDVGCVTVALMVSVAVEVEYTV